MPSLKPTIVAVKRGIQWWWIEWPDDGFEPCRAWQCDGEGPLLVRPFSWYDGHHSAKKVEAAGGRWRGPLTMPEEPEAVAERLANLARFKASKAAAWKKVMEQEAKLAAEHAERLRLLGAHFRDGVAVSRMATVAAQTKK